MRAADVKRWAQSRRAADARERQADVAPSSPEAAMAAALSLIALAGRLHGTPWPEDERSRSEDDRVRQQWARLRALVEGSGEVHERQADVGRALHVAGLRDEQIGLRAVLRLDPLQPAGLGRRAREHVVDHPPRTRQVARVTRQTSPSVFATDSR
jgi:hypothetical protein